MRMAELLINLINYLRVVGNVQRISMGDEYGSFSITNPDGEEIEVSIWKRSKDNE